ncbi:hypothetical protein [uncultured Jannaschia sp.]|uniref:hypothetical protein n=1 Tax=uncultured Jannaschia sp. TaxID=293347 RepID=UPI0026060474|nr:hypothetical protein [uncultured Jannaschia sp.]
MIPLIAGRIAQDQMPAALYLIPGVLIGIGARLVLKGRQTRYRNWSGSLPTLEAASRFVGLKRIHSLDNV